MGSIDEPKFEVSLQIRPSADTSRLAFLQLESDQGPTEILESIDRVCHEAKIWLVAIAAKELG